jgi:hypothetical protein
VSYTIRIDAADGDTRAEIPVPPLEQLQHQAAQDGLAKTVLGALLRLCAEDLAAADQHVPAKDEYLTIADIARMCGVQVQTIHRWRVRDREDTALFPSPTVRIADRPLWSPEVITAWAKAAGKHVHDVA